MEYIKHGDTGQRDDSQPSEWDGERFIMLLRTVHNLKLKIYFWKFAFNIFRLWVIMGN